MKSCLIVDDSSTIRKILRSMYEEFGFTCSEAENGAVALEYCRKNNPDIVMLDWNMPVMTGIEFIREYSILKSGAIPIVVFCTTEHDMSFISQALKAGAADFIMKPFEKDMLKDKLIQLGLLDYSETAE